MEKKKLNLEEKVILHKKMALGYFNSYVEEKETDVITYDAWKFADDATYGSPYFTGDKTFPLKEFSKNTTQGATNETNAYRLTFPDWAPADFKYWASENGFVMKVKWQGHNKNTGKKMGFYSYSFLETNEYGEVTHWETHTNEEYSNFLEVAIGVRGPFHGLESYNKALARILKEDEI